MKQKIKVGIKNTGLIFGITASVFFLTFVVLAWTGPQHIPPTCESGEVGCDVVIHTGSAAQEKSGGLLLNTGGATNGLIVENGNVGIGITEPGTRLHIIGPVRIESGGPLYQWSETDTTDQNFSIRLNSGNLIFEQRSDDFSSQIERMRIDSSGNVGIGTTSPDAKLDIVGGDNSFSWSGDHSDSGYIRIGDLQIEWGKVTSSSWPKSVTFPVAFSSSPTVTTSCDRSSYYSTVGTSHNGPTTTSFNFYILSNAGETCTSITDGHWIAIGQWQ